MLQHLSNFINGKLCILAWNSYFNIHVSAQCAGEKILFQRCDRKKKKCNRNYVSWVKALTITFWWRAECFPLLSGDGRELRALVLWLRSSCLHCTLAAQPLLQDRKSDQLHFSQLNNSDFHQLMSGCSLWVKWECPVQVGETFKCAIWSLFLFSLSEIIIPLKMWKVVNGIQIFGWIQPLLLCLEDNS